MATLQEIAEYYVDRLILQYRTKPRARATVAIAVKQALADDLASSLAAAFDLESAVGAQLDVIGKYVGVPRNVGVVAAIGYFGLWSYSSSRNPANYQGTWDPNTNSPALPDPTTVPGDWYVARAAGDSTAPIASSWLAGDIIVSDGVAWSREDDDNGNGLTTYANPATNSAGEFYSYSSAARSVTDLTDASYRTVIKLRIAQNQSDGTLASIVAMLHQFFPSQISVIDNRDMTLAYTVLSTVPLARELLLAFLPRPMGVGITVTIVSPSPGGGDRITTEGGDILTTEDGDALTTETT